MADFFLSRVPERRVNRFGSVLPAAPHQARAIPADALLVFAPLHKLAFGVAIGTVSGLAIFVLTAGHLLLNPVEGIDLILLAEFFYGYEVSWRGALIGLAWGFGVGWVVGWFAAFCRNFVIATWFFVTRTRAQLEYARSFLDHV